MNNLQDIERMARGIMVDTGVSHVKFRFSKGTKQIGAMHYKQYGGDKFPHTIALSRRWALVMPREEIVEIMLHEIAHVKTINSRQRPHGPEFKRAVRALGGRATDTCFQPSVNIDGTPRKV